MGQCLVAGSAIVLADNTGRVAILQPGFGVVQAHRSMPGQ